MNINKNNYEAFFLDYHEGNLSPQQVADLLLFIEQHPELKEEFESFENITLEEFPSFTFDNKSGLKKEITLENKEEYFIRLVENTLSETEQNLLDQFLKQHPQFLTDLALFQKTKLKADPAIVFENKEGLKRIAATTDDLLISSVEGLLSKGEAILLNEQLAVDAEMRNNLALYQQTKMVADDSIVYENKEELKHDLAPALSKGEGDDRKVIPLFYYVAIAASLLLLFGLYFMFNNNPNEKHFADKKDTSAPVIHTGIVPEKKQEILNNNPVNKPVNSFAFANSPVVKRHVTVNQKQVTAPEHKEEIKPVIENNVASTDKNEVKIIAPLISNEIEQPIASNQQLTTNNQQPIVAQVEKENSNHSSTEFLSLRELAAEKIKEKTLDKHTLAIEKKNGRLKKFNGWDFAQIVSKGVSKLTGRDLEVKPTYNNEGDVTAFALGNGIERKIGR